MIILVVTRNGFDELKSIIDTGKYPVWIGGGVLSETEIETLRKNDVDLTDFNYSIEADSKEDIECALQTISEHHPGERVWLECQP
jgi:phosphoribosylformimino-5-aminoimidazole carboxamide ribonucleotide (ProFAR) isomerase